MDGGAGNEGQNDSRRLVSCLTSSAPRLAAALAKARSGGGVRYILFVKLLSAVALVLECAWDGQSTRADAAENLAGSGRSRRTSSPDTSTWRKSTSGYEQLT